VAATPSFERFCELATQGNLIPVHREIMADLDTPVSAFLKLGDAPYTFLLESVEGGEKWARYSFLGSDPRVIIRGRGDDVSVTEDGVTQPLSHDGNPLLAVRSYMERFKPVSVDGLPPFAGGAVGFIAYDMVRYFEDIPVHPEAVDSGTLGLDDFCFMITDRLVIFDAARQVIQVVANAHTDGVDLKEAYNQALATIDATVKALETPLKARETHVDPHAGAPVTSNMKRECFHRMVADAKEYIRAGDIFQVVLSQRFTTPIATDPLDLYRALRRINPSPYMYYLKLDDTYIVGASPEVLVRTQHDRVEVRPIAGTRPRGATPKEDQALEQDLLADAKECAEHLMLVDLGRNDVGRVAKIGTVSVDDFMLVERYSHVMHIVSHVSGELAPGRDAFDVLTACFPAGTLSGAPKIRAMEIIAEQEPNTRGPYGGAVGYFGFDGNSDMAINIRTVLIKDGHAYFQAGAGIVADSDPEAEFMETKHKAGAVARAIDLARQGLNGGQQ
jgi:anthranilate synthase component 1